MDGQVLRNAGVINADAIIIGNAHDADPKDVSHPPPPLMLTQAVCEAFNLCMQLLLHASCFTLALTDLHDCFCVLLYAAGFVQLCPCSVGQGTDSGVNVLQLQL